MSELPLVGELFGLQVFRAELLGPAPFSLKDLEDFFGGDLPDPVDLVAGHYEVEPGDGELYLAVRTPGGWIEWDAERVEVAGKVWRWIMGIDDGKAA